MAASFSHKSGESSVDRKAFFYFSGVFFEKSQFVKLVFGDKFLKLFGADNKSLTEFWCEYPQRISKSWIVD